MPRPGNAALMRLPEFTCLSDCEHWNFRLEPAARGLGGRQGARRLQRARGRVDQPVAAQRDRCGVRFTTVAKEAARADQVDRVLVYVPTLDRYFDPALPLEEQGLVDLLVRERAEQTRSWPLARRQRPRCLCRQLACGSPG
jgi:hypothetical protein